MKRIKDLLKQFWSVVKKRKALLFLLFVALVIVVNTLFYLFTGRLPIGPTTESANPFGVGQTQNGQFFESTAAKYEVSSDQLINNLPYNSINFKVSQLPSDADGAIIILVGLQDSKNTSKFGAWLKQYKYPDNAKFIFYQLPK